MATATLNNPTEDGYVKWNGAATYDREEALANMTFGWVFEAPPEDTNRAYVEWDVSGISGIITKVEFRYNGKANVANSWIYAMANQPSVQSDDNAGNQVIFDDAGGGTAYLSNDAVFPEVGTGKDVGGASGPAWDTDPSSDLQAALGGGWFAFGFKITETLGSPTTFNEIYTEEEGGVNPAPTLYVEYTAPVVVTPPTLALALTFYEPTVSTPRLVTPTTLSLILSTFVPSIVLGTVATPATLALVLAFFAPFAGLLRILKIKSTISQDLTIKSTLSTDLTIKSTIGGG